jgi:hypothetical protein
MLDEVILCQRLVYDRGTRGIDNERTYVGVDGFQITQANRNAQKMFVEC